MGAVYAKSLPSFITPAAQAKFTEGQEGFEECFCGMTYNAHTKLSVSHFFLLLNPRLFDHKI